MEPLNHSFTVPVAIAEAWNVLTNVERIAPCLPGAQLQEIEGETYRGAVKVKVGPIQAQFKGQASFVEKDDANYKVVLKGEGRDTGGKGNASAVITAQLTAIDASSTQVNVNTDLSITGKVAQFGRGALADVSDKLLAQFSENLNNLIAAEPAVATAAPAPEAAPDTGQPTVRKIDAPEVAPINLIETAGATIVKRALPVVAGIIVIVLLAIAIF
ncbi:MAG: carbon monoxide dehydrogenase [Ilumatobacteraceae bacterium]|nr:carbon monoxide dehydrogenase [Ilumatobacteraceae bacterium]